jgi:hypothetical protein
VNRELVDQVLGPMGSLLDSLFKQMEIAEDEIAAAKERWPDSRDELHDSFKLLQPEAGMFERLNEGLYRQHCRELLERVANGASRNELALGTKAEVLRLMSEWSLENSPGHEASALMAWLFSELFPGALGDDAPSTPEPWEGRNAELFSELQRKIARRTSRAEKQD